MAAPLKLKAYGSIWTYPSEIPVEMAMLDVEKRCFVSGRTVEEGGLGKAGHFKNICRVLAPEFIWLDDDPDVAFEDAWPDRIVDELVRFNYVAITGPASATKTEVVALWILISWIVRFDKTLVLITSTGKGDARRRIWASIKERYQKIVSLGFKIGRYTENPQTMIAANDGSPETAHLSDRSSISLMAVDPGKEGASINRLIGYKQEHVILVADEMTGMSPAVLKACHNLSANPNFQFIGIGNADLRTDSHGKFCEPADGWVSVSENDFRWRTKLGICLHLDGARTPNRTTNPVDKYPFIITTKKLAADKENYGENTHDFWRMCRGFWAPQGVAGGYYSDLEISAAGGDQKAIWREMPIRLAFLDPAFKAGGDSFMVSICSLGNDNRGVRVFDLTEQIKLQEDVTADESVAKQIASQFVTLCREKGISVRQCGGDSTGGGSLILDYIEDLFGAKGLMRISFGDSASDLVVEIQDKEDILAKDRYADLVTEIWAAGLQYIRSGQLRGLNSKVIEQMVKRQFLNVGKRKKVEPKPIYKSRTSSKSPDEADSYFGCLHLARSRFGFATTAGKANKKHQDDSWAALAHKLAPQENTGQTEFTYGG